MTEKLNPLVKKEMTDLANRMYGLGKTHGLELALTVLQNYPPDEQVMKLTAMVAKCQVALESLDKEGD